MTREIIKNMPFDEYLALERLSNSGIKKILVSSQDFWVSSWMNKNKKEYKSDAFNLGTAYHKMIIEGDSAFDKAYAVAEKVDGRTKEGKAYKESWALEHPTATAIDVNTYQQISVSLARGLDVFKGGDSEVTILWNDEETNSPMKARLDYLQSGHIYDLKTFSNEGEMNIDVLIARHIVNYKYHVQAAVYREALPDHNFTFVFQQTGEINNCRVRNFPSRLLIAESGRRLMREGINKFAEMYIKNGENPWFDEVSNDEMNDEQFPIWSL